MFEYRINQAYCELGSTSDDRAPSFFLFSFILSFSLYYFAKKNQLQRKLIPKEKN